MASMIPWNLIDKKYSEQFKGSIAGNPERMLADKIYTTRDNLDYCKKNSISRNSPKLGRPPKGTQVKPAFI